MKRLIVCLSLALSSVPVTLVAQTQDSSVAQSTAAPAARTAKAKKTVQPLKPFSRLALGGGFSLMGANLQAATDVNKYMNLRATGNLFNYTVNNISSNGFSGDAKLNMATAGASLDFYPFPNHGFRLSPGILFYNQNALSANVTVASGQSFKLNGVEYYTDSAPNQVLGSANMGLNSTNPAFTITTGWGNMISRRGGHWSFPFEFGAAFVGSPSLNVNLSGMACADEALTDCVNVATDPTFQSNLQAQVAKWKSDLNPLMAYPILSFGVAYNFHLR